jgi:4a-hydroxytetrahydrobiopterin dehydratase
MLTLLDEEKKAQMLHELKYWPYADEQSAIARQFRFADFADAIAFVARVALAAEKLGHHPDWSSSHNKVTITPSGHDAGGLSQLDAELAHTIERIYRRCNDDDNLRSSSGCVAIPGLA